MVPKGKKVQNEVINDTLQGVKEIIPEEVGEKSYPSPSKSTIKTSMWKDKLKKATREDEEETDQGYILKFMDHYICKQMEKGFEDIVQWQSNLQEMQL